MLGERSDQRGLWEADQLYMDHVGKDTFYGLMASLRGRLFRDVDFAVFYCSDNGRDSVPPSLPHYRRATPSDFLPSLGKSLPSNTHTASGCPSLRARRSFSRSMTAATSQRASVRKRYITRAKMPTDSETFSTLRRSLTCTSRAWR